MENIMGVYKIENLENNKVYIGSASNLHKREMRHKSGLRGGKHFNESLQDDFSKYGEDAFRYQILEEIEDKDKIRNREMFWINEYKAINNNFGYNSMPTIKGEAPNRDFKQKSEGERNKRAVIKAKDVIDICKRLNSGESVVSIVDIYGVAQETIYRILRGQRWRDIGEVYFSSEILSNWKLKPDEKGIHPDLLSHEALKEICNGINNNISDGELAISHGLSASGIAVIRKGGCRSSETVCLLNDEVLSLWTYNIHLVESLMPKKKPKKLFVDKKNGNQALTNTQIKEICEKLNRGLYPNEIANEYGVSSGTIHHIRMGEYYVEISDKYLSSEVKEKRQNRAKTAGQLSDKSLIEICELLNQGVPVKIISLQMSVVKSTIYRIKNRENYREIIEQYLK